MEAAFFLPRVQVGDQPHRQLGVGVVDIGIDQGEHPLDLEQYLVHAMDVA